MSYQQAYFNLMNKLPNGEDVQKRLSRAYDIVTGYGYEIVSQGQGEYLISKASTSLFEDNSVTYAVNNKECSCPDFEKARAGLCKHRLAVMLIEENNDNKKEC